MSPDEVALVQAAFDAGIVFKNRVKHNGGSSSQVAVSSFGEPVKLYTILHELPFDSDRKRMSVIVRTFDNEVWCVTKGADTIMEPLLAEPMRGDDFNNLAGFAKQGLRTLVLAMKSVSAEALSSWQAELAQAEAIVDNTRNDQIAEVMAKMELQLNFVGITAVEDRLQDGVPTAISTLKECGIRVWVLTGDKTETAVDIARSCALFNTNTKLAYATEAEDIESTLLKLKAAKDEIEGFQDSGLVLDGRTVKFALGNDEAKALIYQLGIASRSCVCCRLSPMQKRQLVELVQEKSPGTITLAIGDGANDVPMIEGAHIGIGIRGKEGAQAVQVSDVAISQFRFLVPLLLCHGRRAYRRVSTFLCYYMYKNVVIVMGDVVWAHQDLFKARIAFPEYLSMGYNACFTSWHSVFVLAFDACLPDAIANTTPMLYHDGPKRALFNGKVFAVWMFYAIYHGIACWMIPNLAFGGTEYWPNDKPRAAWGEMPPKQPMDFWLGSCTSFSLVVVTVNIRLLLYSMRPFNMPSMLSTLGASAMFIVWLFCLGQIPLGKQLQPSLAGAPVAMFENKSSLLCLLLTPIAVLSVDVVHRILRHFLFFSDAEQARRQALRACATRVAPAPVQEKDPDETNVHTANGVWTTVDAQEQNSGDRKLTPVTPTGS